MGCIYKITNPIQEVYIGQTINYDKRLRSYKRLSCEGQIKLYDSLSKFGVDNHVFEVLEQCDDIELYRRENYWISFYNSYEKGLNAEFGTNKDYKRRGKAKDKSLWNILKLKKSFFKPEKLKKPKKYIIDSWSQRILWDEMSKYMLLHASYIVKYQLWHSQKDKEVELQDLKTKLLQQSKRFMRASCRTTQIEYRQL